MDVEDSDTMENSKRIGYYNATENLSIPKFTKTENMHKMIAKPAGNMLKLRCVAEGESGTFEERRIYITNRPRTYGTP